MGTQRVSMDIGGTFTDVVAYDDVEQRFVAAKASTTPHNLTQGALAGLSVAAADLTDIVFMVHGTTQGLNAFLTRQGERVLLLATQGVEHQLHIARGPRWRLYDLHYRKPEPLVPLTDIVPIPGRLSAEGDEVAPLDEDAVRAAGRRAREMGISSVAVAFLYSFRFPQHELRADEILREELGEEATITLSHRTANEWREFERTSSAVVEAYTGPVVRRYLNRLDDALTTKGLRAPLHIMQSSGGVLSVDAARDRPLQTLLSGPVGGTMGGVALSRALGRPNLICVDMGGTSFDVSLVIDGEPDVTAEATLEGLPLLMPAVNIHTVGAGGGSVAWLEHGGLRVGPRSAGATPGPACYSRGGTEPTVTDANLVLGRVDPDGFAGGSMQLDTAAARRAVDSIAQTLGLDAAAMAQGICDVANAKMAQAIRTLTVARGIEPRDFALVAFGGAGPMHAVFLAQELGISEVVIPPFPGAFSAWGMLQSSLRVDTSRSFFFRDEDIDVEVMAHRLEDLERETHAFLEEEAIAPADRAITHSVDVRYVDQEFTLTIPLLAAQEPRAESFLTTLGSRFAEAHMARYGHANLGAPIEVVALRTTGLGTLPTPPIHHRRRGEPPAVDVVRRPVAFAGQWHETPIVRRDDLPAAERSVGPRIIVEDTATTVVPPGCSVTTHPTGALIVTA